MPTPTYELATRAITRGVRLSVDKGRLVADLIRGRSVADAVDLLTFSPKKAAGILLKTLNSAIANAEHNLSADIDALVVHVVHVEQGPTLKRFSARAKGRGNRISKPTCHIYLGVGTPAGKVRASQKKGR